MVNVACQHAPSEWFESALSLVLQEKCELFKVRVTERYQTAGS